MIFEQPVKKLTAFYETEKFIATVTFIDNSHGLNKSSLQLFTFFKIHFSIIFYLILGIPTILFLSEFEARILYEFFYNVRVKCCFHFFLLNSIILIMFGEEAIISLYTQLKGLGLYHIQCNFCLMTRSGSSYHIHYNHIGYYVYDTIIITILVTMYMRR